MQTFADQRVAIGTRLWICSYRARRLLSSNVIVKCDFFFYVESNSDFDFQQFAHWVQLSSFLVLGSLFHLFQVVLCCIGISHSFPALTNVLFPLIFFFCYAGFKSFDWWPIDWANLSYSLQCAFPPHSAYRMSVRVCRLLICDPMLAPVAVREKKRGNERRLDILLDRRTEQL